MSVALVHDYLTQRGGAERVVLALLRAFPGAPLYTSLYDPDGTFPEFRSVDVRTLPLNHIPPLRRDHRLALPLLAPAFSRLVIDADVVLCSSSGWAHGVRARGRKIVYCYTPARWLYQSERYLATSAPAARLALALLRPALARWDLRAARSADRYLAISTPVRERIRSIYAIDSEVVPAPHSIDVDAPKCAIDDCRPGFYLCVSRLLPYKNVGSVVDAFRGLADERLIVVGDGPERRSLEQSTPPNVDFLGTVADDALRWLYANCAGVISASYEDFGLTPLEAAAFGKPSAVLRWGGFLDTVIEGETGVFFAEPVADEIRGAVEQLRDHAWDANALRVHATRFEEQAFIERIRELASM